MMDVEVKVREVHLPHDPRNTMARLRGGGQFALLESALPTTPTAPTAGLGQWSYIAGPALATLYTDAHCATWLEHDGTAQRLGDDPFDALQAMVSCAPHTVRLEGDVPEGMNFIGGWVGVAGYALASQLVNARGADPVADALPLQWWLAVDQVLAYHHASQRWWQATTRGPQHRWPWSTAQRNAVWHDTLAAARGPAPARRGWRAGPLQQKTTEQAFKQSVEEVREAIARGDLLQANLTRREEAPFEGDPWALYEDLAAANPAPFAAYLEGPGFAMASCSPERFLRRQGPEIEARPIKGTAPRGSTPCDDEQYRQTLAASPKDRAENLMIADLMRNDLGRVAEVGSVQVPELFSVEAHASVWQMVSVVRARLRADCGLADLLRACWPPGSMTGAPKIQAMRLIHALEPVQRGWYSGSVGYLDCRGHMDWSVIIRSAIVVGSTVTVQLGGGIVWDSHPDAEWQETVAKGRRIIGVIQRGGPPHAQDLQPSPTT